MTTIDWSKAPNGATHYVLEDGEHHSCWLRMDGDRIVEFWGISQHHTYTTGQPIIPGERIPRPQYWDGQGVPPVGTKCEYRNGSGHWHAVTITGHGLLGVLFQAEGRNGENYARKDSEFRPLRTHEQFASKAREDVITEMARDSKRDPRNQTTRTQLGRLYDVGYRKVEGATP